MPVLPPHSRVISMLCNFARPEFARKRIKIRGRVISMRLLSMDAVIPRELPGRQRGKIRSPQWVSFPARYGFRIHEIVISCRAPGEILCTRRNCREQLVMECIAERGERGELKKRGNRFRRTAKQKTLARLCEKIVDANNLVSLYGGKFELIESMGR